jgi:hypothetical protein
MWAAGLLHDRAIGVQTFLFWSESAWTKEERRFASRILAHAASMESRRADLPDRLSETDPEAALKPWLEAARAATSGDSRP